LPAIPGFTVAPRPPDAMPAIYLFADPTIVRRTYVLDPSGAR
jgi:hypothetical protein